MDDTGGSDPLDPRAGAALAALAPNLNPWDDMLVQGLEPSRSAAIALLARMAVRPPVVLLDEVMGSIEMFHGVPATPAPSAKAEDKFLHESQQMMESILQLLILQEESTNDQAVPISVVALSLFHKFNERRRALLVQGTQGVIHKQPTGPRLLTDDEELRFTAAKSRQALATARGSFGRGGSPGGRGAGKGSAGRGWGSARGWAPRGRPSASETS
jgi:hypothetical protein